MRAMKALALAALALIGGPRVDFHGLPALVVRNPAAEVLVVPEIGRVVRFSLLGDQSGGPLWVNPTLGRRFTPDAEGWNNHGGDKTWPAPQADWQRVTGRAWPPPAGFDATPFTAEVQPEQRRIELVSPVDPAYGIRVRRTIALDARAPLMTVDTVYEKVDGAPVRVAIWTITQLAPAERVFVELPARSAFPRGHVALLPAAPPALAITGDGRLLSFAHDAREKTMIGSDAAALLWMGETADLVVTHVSGRGPGPGTSPGGGLRSQIYTSPDPAAKYVELELLDRLRDLAPGQRASMRVSYRLVPRVERDPEREARRAFARPPRSPSPAAAPAVTAAAAE